MLEPALRLESIAPGRTSIATHPFSSGEHPRDLTDSADQSILSVVRPSTLGSRHGVDRRGFVRVSIKFVRREALEKALGGRRAVLIGRSRARAHRCRCAELARQRFACFGGSPGKNGSQMGCFGEISRPHIA